MGVLVIKKGATCHFLQGLLLQHLNITDKLWVPTRRAGCTKVERSEVCHSNWIEDRQSIHNLVMHGPMFSLLFLKKLKGDRYLAQCT